MSNIFVILQFFQSWKSQIFCNITFLFNFENVKYFVIVHFLKLSIYIYSYFGQLDFCFSFLSITDENI